jgi:hypothetical protein
MEKPTQTEKAQAYETTRHAYREAFSTMNSSRFISSSLDHLTAEEQAEKLAEIEAYILEKLEATNKTFQLLKELQTADLVQGKHEFYECERALGTWAEQARHREAYEANPEEFTLHAIAVKKVMREAEAHAKKPWNKLTNYYWFKAVYATVQGLTLEEAEEALDRYIEARQMSYTVSTKNLKMKVA